MKRSLSLAESASRAKEQRNIGSSENQDADVREEERVDESTLKEDLADNTEAANMEPPFSGRYERITTYLEKSLFRRVHELHPLGEIKKIANLFNAAVREYVDRYYLNSSIT